MVTAIQGGEEMKLLSRIVSLLRIAPAQSAGNWWGVSSSFSTVAAPPATAENKADESLSDDARQIVTTRLQKKSVTLSQRFVCQINSHRHIEVRAISKGLLEEIHIKEGQGVREGDLMFKIQPTLFQSRLDVENAEAKIAQIEYNFTKKLFEDKVTSANEVLIQEARLARAKARAKLAAAELDSTAIKAPFDGIFGRLKLQKGSVVLEGEALATLSDNSVLSVYFNVPENLYLEYTAEQHPKEKLDIELILSNGAKFNQPGQINAIDAEFNPETGTIQFRADFPNPERQVRHGQRGTVIARRKSQNDVIVVPQKAIFENLEKRYVYVVDKQDIAHQREIVIQQESDQGFVVSKGLVGDEKIIVKGIHEVRDGDKVQVED
jgi:membrane fusion protein (multidrug efflux system)